MKKWQRIFSLLIVKKNWAITGFVQLKIDIANSSHPEIGFGKGGPINNLPINIAIISPSIIFCIAWVEGCN
jgi:hypothetical protein